MSSSRGLSAVALPRGMTVATQPPVMALTVGNRSTTSSIREPITGDITRQQSASATYPSAGRPDYITFFFLRKEEGPTRWRPTDYITYISTISWDIY